MNVAVVHWCRRDFRRKTIDSSLLELGSQDKPSFIDAIRDTPATVAEALICFFAVWSVLGLWGYHTYLICRSVTTNEDVCGKGVDGERLTFLFVGA